ncbi:DUF5709 domain-containing protein [Nocardioides donggukensis]|uniref:DUF5709 domain-containing protein n=1 Tax=Nocardioides donggukensis TaxID=2774019 RepID=A0A927PZH0_9ACTN|nr:DUF5709 domain-containing protein [Nocardioides donggukensis]MBD8870163.1 hypothetical protein [Nocardioides donggukensis]
MSEDQLQPQDTLDDRGVDDVLDEGISPPEKPRGVDAVGVTDREQIEGETIDDRLAQEQPEVWEDAEAEADAEILDGDVDGEVGAERSGRLVAPDEGLDGGLDERLIEDLGAELVAEDVGIDGAGAPAEEAAIHTIDED